MRWFEVHTSPTTDWRELPAEASIVLWNCYLLNWIIASYLVPSFHLCFTPRRGSAFRGLTFLIKEQSVGWRLRVNDDPISVRSQCLWRSTFSLLHRKMRPIRQDLSIVEGFFRCGETKWNKMSHVGVVWEGCFPLKYLHLLSKGPDGAGMPLWFIFLETESQRIKDVQFI